MFIIQYLVFVIFYRNICYIIKNFYIIFRNMYDYIVFVKYMFDYLLSMWFFFKLIYYYYVYFIVEKKFFFFIIIIIMELFKNKVVCLQYCY